MIRSSAPARIDLAGGTLDIWPLYHYFDHPPTLNAAIDLYATVEIEPRGDKRVVVESKDLNLKESFRSLASLPERHPLELILRSVKFYRPADGLKITTHCEAPAGSGIGGSSALNIALQGALHAWSGLRIKKNRIIELAKNIETQVISVPTGWQDYFPALYGGVLALQPGLAGMAFRRLPLNMNDLSRRFVLCYTGKPRASGINNWAVMKKSIDGDKKTNQNLERIKRCALKMEKILSKGDLDRLASPFSEEWKSRKALAPGISTPQMDRLLHAAQENGALAGKVCGAGGGGCIAFFVKKGFKDRVETALRELGGRVLNFKFVQRGLQIRKFPE